MKIKLSKSQWEYLSKKAQKVSAQEIIDSIKSGKNQFFGYSHFSLDNMYDYGMMSDTIHDLMNVYGINEIEASNIVQTLTHPGRFTEEELKQMQDERELGE